MHLTIHSLALPYYASDWSKFCDALYLQKRINETDTFEFMDFVVKTGFNSLKFVEENIFGIMK